MRRPTGGALAAVEAVEALEGVAGPPAGFGQSSACFSIPFSLAVPLGVLSLKDTRGM